MNLDAAIANLAELRAAYVAAWHGSGPTGREVGDQLILRTARKEYRCSARSWRPVAGGPDVLVRCCRIISVGTRYIEYLGESAGYQSGSRSCLDCAAREWVGSPYLHPLVSPGDPLRPVAGHAAACSVHRGGSCDRLGGCLQDGRS